MFVIRFGVKTEDKKEASQTKELAKIEANFENFRGKIVTAGFLSLSFINHIARVDFTHTKKLTKT